MRRNFTLTLVVGAGISLSGCQSPMLGGFSVLNRGGSATSATPDVAKQKFSGLAQSTAGGDSATSALGGNREAKTGILASFTKSTAAAGAAFTGKKAVEHDDPLRLDNMPKKISADVYVGAARLMENQGKFAEAEEKYRDAIRVAPTDLNALIGLARLYDRQGQGQKAIDVYQRAAQAHPTNGLVFNDVGLCFRRQRQLDKSVIAFRKAVEFSPDNPKYRNNLAGALVDAGKPDEAFEHLVVANSAAVAHFNLAYLLQQKGDRQGSIGHLQQALSLDASLTPAREMLAHFGVNPTVGIPADQFGPRPAVEQTARVQPVEQSAPQFAAPQSTVPVAAYSAGATETPVYTSVPQVYTAAPQQAATAETQQMRVQPTAHVAAAAPEPSSYHFGDEAPALETAQRSAWSAAAWALPAAQAPAAPSAIKSLPPVN